MKTVVITGASTGIGLATAEHLADRGWQVFAGIRSRDDAARLREISSQIEPVQLDVTKTDQIAGVLEQVERALDGRTLTGLVNNAGIAQMGPITIQPMAEIERHFQVNVLGTIRVTQAFAPLLGQDRERAGKPGRIINVTSVGGEIASPFLGAYTATKHALESFTDTLRRELAMFGIDAIAVGPGAVKTPIWSKAERSDGTLPYQDTPWADAFAAFLSTMVQAGERGLPVERVAETIETALTAAKPSPRYAPVPNKLVNYHLLKALPKRWADKVFINRFGLGSTN